MFPESQAQVGPGPGTHHARQSRRTTTGSGYLRFRIKQQPRSPETEYVPIENDPVCMRLVSREALLRGDAIAVA